MTPPLVAVGALTRFWIAHHLDGRTPYGTWLVNVAGSFVLGVVVGSGSSSDALALLGTGFCGGLTTYSAFAVQTRDQARDHGSATGAAYAAATVVLAVAACALGFWLSVSPAGPVKLAVGGRNVTHPAPGLPVKQSGTTGGQA